MPEDEKLWEKIAYNTPWALLVMIGVMVYVGIELKSGGLKPAQGVSAIVGIAGLAIGHGVHEHARRHS